MHEQLEGLRIYSSTSVFIRGNNNEGFVGMQWHNCNITEEYDRGSYWNTLFCDVSNRVAYRLGSLISLNSYLVLSVVNTLDFTFKTLNCHQNNNTCECGLNVLVNPEMIFCFYCSVVNSCEDFGVWFQQHTAYIHIQ